MDQAVRRGRRPPLEGAAPPLPAHQAARSPRSRATPSPVARRSSRPPTSGWRARAPSSASPRSPAACSRSAARRCGSAARSPYTVAAELLLTGRQVPPHEAKDIGLIGHVVPDGTALDKAMEIAEVVAGNAPLSVKAVLRVAPRGRRDDRGRRPRQRAHPRVADLRHRGRQGRRHAPSRRSGRPTSEASRPIRCPTASRGQRRPARRPRGSRVCRRGSGRSRRPARGVEAACSRRASFGSGRRVRRASGWRRALGCTTAATALPQRSSGTPTTRTSYDVGVSLQSALDLLGEDLLAAGVDADRAAAEQGDRCRPPPSGRSRRRRRSACRRGR